MTMKLSEALVKLGRFVIDLYHENESFWKKHGVTPETDFTKLKKMSKDKKWIRECVFDFLKMNGEPKVTGMGDESKVKAMLNSPKKEYEYFNSNPRCDIGNVECYTYYELYFMKDDKAYQAVYRLYADPEDKKKNNDMAMRPSIAIVKLKV